MCLRRTSGHIPTETFFSLTPLSTHWQTGQDPTCMSTLVPEDCHSSFLKEQLLPYRSRHGNTSSCFLLDHIFPPVGGETLLRWLFWYGRVQDGHCLRSTNQCAVAEVEILQFHLFGNWIKVAVRKQLKTYGCVAFVFPPQVWRLWWNIVPRH